MRHVYDAFDEYAAGASGGEMWTMWMEKVEELKRDFSSLIGARRDEVTITHSASTGILSVLSGLARRSRRNRIIISREEFPAVLVPSLAMRRLGLRTALIDGHEVEDYEDVIDDSTLLISAFVVSSISGVVQDLKGLVELAHSKDVYVLADASQAAGVLNVDVKHMDVDFLVTDVHKHLLGTVGSALLYVKGKIVEGMEPIFTGWLSQSNPFLLGRRRLKFAAGADRFQLGTWSIFSVYTAINGIRLIMDRGITSIEDKSLRLARKLAGTLLSDGFYLLTDPNETGEIVSVRTRRPRLLERLLAKRGIVASARGAGVRLSTHFFLDDEDVNAAVEALRAIKRSGRLFPPQP